MRFEVNGQMFFVNFVPEEGRWYCYAPTAAGVQRIPVATDGAPFASFVFPVDEQAKEVVNQKSSQLSVLSSQLDIGHHIADPGPHGQYPSSNAVILSEVEGTPRTLAALILLKGVLPVQHKYWTYTVASSTGTLYIGMTNDLYVRVQEQKSQKFEGFSGKQGCNRLVYWESFDEVIKAINREKQLKGWRGSKKIALIRSMNPWWEDLAGKWGAQLAFADEPITSR